MPNLQKQVYKHIPIHLHFKTFLANSLVLKVLAVIFASWAKSSVDLGIDNKAHNQPAAH